MCPVTAVVWPHTVSLLQHLTSCAINVTTPATGSTKGARALLCPRVTNIPSAFTKPSLWNQIHCVAQQITSRRPRTPAQSFSPQVFFFLLLPYPICQVETGCEKWLLLFNGATGVRIAVYCCVTDNN